MGIPEKDKKGTEEIFETITTEFFQIDVKYQTTSPGSLENTK